MKLEQRAARPPFRLVPNLDSASWLMERLDHSDPLQRPALNWLVPDGFEALVRVFPPLLRQRIVGMSWQDLDEMAEPWRWPERAEIFNEPVSWAVASAALGQPFPPDISVTRLLDIGGRDSVDAGEWRYSTGGITGRMPLELLNTVASVLAKHTETPGTGVAALWEGYGWHPEQEEGVPVLQLPARSYHCFEAGIDEFIAPDWANRSPWGPLNGAPEPSNYPNLIWPEDAGWLLVSEIDYWSTLVACSNACAMEILAHPDIEAVIIDRDSTVD